MGRRRRPEAERNANKLQMFYRAEIPPSTPGVMGDLLLGYVYFLAASTNAQRYGPPMALSTQRIRNANSARSICAFFFRNASRPVGNPQSRVSQSGGRFEIRLANPMAKYGAAPIYFRIAQ